MSFRADKLWDFKDSSFTRAEDYLGQKSADDIKSLFNEILTNGIHGFCFSLYEDGQKPGDIISREQVMRRIEILKPHTQWVRSFSTIEGNEWIPKLAKQNGIKTLVGAWLGDDEKKNNEEIENLIQLAKDGYVDIAAVGNEVLYRNDMSSEQLIQHINKVKEAVPNIPVGYVDAYYEFVQHPEISELCDVILCNCYPYWEGTEFDLALSHMQHMYDQAKIAGNGKKVIITETGWPSQGESLKNAIPSANNALQYFVNAYLWAAAEDVDIFYFSSFDESWKVGAEGEVGAYWGIWDKSEKLKF